MGVNFALLERLNHSFPLGNMVPGQGFATIPARGFYLVVDMLARNVRRMHPGKVNLWAEQAYAGLAPVPMVELFE